MHFSTLPRHADVAMLDLYLEVLLKWPEAVRQVVTKWRFWFWFALIIGAYVVPNVYWQRYLSVQDGFQRYTRQ